MASVNIKLYYYRDGDRNPITDIRRLRLPVTVSYADLAKRITESQNWIGEGVTFKYVDEENDLVQFSSQDEWRIALESIHEKQDKVLRLRISNPTPVREEPRNWHGARRGPWGCGGWRRRHQQAQQHGCPFGQQQGGDLSEIFAAVKPFIDSLVQNLQQEQPKQEETKQESQQQSQVHFGVTCDGCDQEHIRGDRFKCTECPDFDYCSNCYNTSEMRDSHGNHKFEKIDVQHRQQHPFGGFDFSQLLNHPLAQQFMQGGAQQFDFSNLAQQFMQGAQGKEQNQFDFSQLLNHPLAQQFMQGGQNQQFDFSQIMNNIQPFINQFAQNFGEQQQSQQQEAKSTESKPAEPQPTEEEIVINEDEPKNEEVKQPQSVPVFAYKAQLEQLVSMGFDEVERNKDLLTRYNGNVGRVVQVLLQ